MSDHNYATFEVGGQLKPQLPPELEILLDVDLELAPPDAPGFSRRPDLIMVQRSARVRQRNEGGIVRACEVALALELISPGSRRTDLVVERGEYADAGIPHSWVLDLTAPVSLLVLHQAGELGYAVTGECTGRATLTEPFPVVLELDELV